MPSQQTCTRLCSALSGVVQILASQDAHMLRVEVRLGAIEKRLEMHDPALPG